ncbi:hypothetical protein ACFYN3_09455 [Streptomyces lavendulae]|uniref:hypothetical protein n=1 Tax=Streptomyces lavendulae TaxID=1914 RepID=UPI0033FDE391
MDVARLVLDYLKVLLWPSVVLFVVLWFRNDVRGLFRRIRSLSAPGVDAEFSDEVDAVSAEAEAALRAAAAQSGSTGADAAITMGPPDGDWGFEALEYVARLSPSAGIVGAWKQVESQLFRMALADDPSVVRWTPRLVDSLDVPPKMKETLHDMRRLRNEAAHTGTAETATPDAAVGYVRSCARVVGYLEGRYEHRLNRLGDS